MRQFVGIAAVALVAAASVWAFALTHSSAKIQDRVPGAAPSAVGAPASATKTSMLRARSAANWSPWPHRYLHAALVPASDPIDEVSYRLAVLAAVLVRVPEHKRSEKPDNDSVFHARSMT